MRTKALINPASGSVPPDAEAALKDALGRLDATAEITMTEPDGLEDQVRALIDDAPERLIVWGGDGTTACVLGHAGSDGPDVIALPGGTMNLLHKALHSSRANDWRACLEHAWQGEATELPAGKICGHTFFVAANFGRLARLADSREALRDGELIRAARDLVGENTFDLSPDLSLTLDDESTARDLPAMAAFCPKPGEPLQFDCALLDTETTLGTMRAAVESMIGDWRTAEGVTQMMAKRIALSYSGERGLPATLDGERLDLPKDCTLHIEPKAARVLRAST